MAAVGAEAVIDLHRKLTRRREDQRAYRVPSGREACVGLGAQTLEHGQREGGRLARAGLGATHHIAALAHQRYCLLLDRSRSFIALLAYGAQYLGTQPEVVECQSCLIPLVSEYAAARLFMPRPVAIAKASRRAG